MNNFETNHEGGTNTPAPKSENLITNGSSESSVIPTELQGLPADRVVKGIRALRLAEIAEQHEC